MAETGRKCKCGAPALIVVSGYTGEHDLVLCRFCSSELAKRLLDDLCDWYEAEATTTDSSKVV